MVAPSGDGALTVLQADGEKVVIPESEVEQKVRSKVSSMPQGLLNSLSVEDIADLFAYLEAAPRGETATRPTLIRRQ